MIDRSGRTYEQYRQLFWDQQEIIKKLRATITELKQEAHDEEQCDRCGIHVPDGAGNYVLDDRVCFDCYVAYTGEAP